MTGFSEQVTGIVVRQVDYRDPDAQLLVRAALAELGERYGGAGDETPVDPSDFDPPGGAFLVAYLDATPVACGAWRSHGDDGTVAEIKRMYTDPEIRGRGLGRSMLAAVEESARGAGRKRIILETGTEQPEAVALYETAGYLRIADFGYYRGNPKVLSYGRQL